MDGGTLKTTPGFEMANKLCGGSNPCRWIAVSRSALCNVLINFGNLLALSARLQAQCLLSLLYRRIWTCVA